MAQHPKRPRDPNALAQFIVQAATGQIAIDEDQAADSPKTAALREWGAKGGSQRATSLGPKQRREIARKAAHSRWHSDKK